MIIEIMTRAPVNFPHLGNSSPGQLSYASLKLTQKLASIVQLHVLTPAKDSGQRNRPLRNAVPEQFWRFLVEGVSSDKTTTFSDV